MRYRSMSIRAFKKNRNVSNLFKFNGKCSEFIR